MEKRLKNIMWGKHWDTDIDTITLFLDDTSKDSVVGEFEVPENEKYMLYYSETKDEKFLNWIMVVNPEGILKGENISIPNVTVIYEDKKFSLQEIIRKIVDEQIKK